MPAHVVLHQIHEERFWPQSWALQINIWDKWTWAHQEPEWLSLVHKANPGLLSGTAEDHRAFWEEIDNDLNLEMSVTWVSVFSLLKKKIGGRISGMTKKEYKKITEGRNGISKIWAIWVPMKLGLDTGHLCNLYCSPISAQLWPQPTLFQFWTPESSQVYCT